MSDEYRDPDPDQAKMRQALWAEIASAVIAAGGDYPDGSRLATVAIGVADLVLAAFDGRFGEQP